MRAGRIIARRPLLPVTFRLAGQPNLTIDFQVDTGFTEFLTLPVAAVTAMGLPYLRPVFTVLADASRSEMALYRATIFWDGEELDVPVLATGRRPLLGAALLDGHELRARYAEGDLVTVEEL